MKQIDVAVGVVVRATRIFVCLRGEHQHQGGKWEFPGGKLDDGETVIDALSRELLEEIGITVLRSTPLIVIEHAYPDKHVRLDVHMVTDFDGEPTGKEGQPAQWVEVSQLDTLVFPEANQPIIEALRNALR